MSGNCPKRKTSRRRPTFQAVEIPVGRRQPFLGERWKVSVLWLLSPVGPIGSTGPRSRSTGLWTPWRGVRGPKSAPVDGEHELFGFLTTEPNATVAPIHPKAMPVILTRPEEVGLWLAADAPMPLELQRPLPDDARRIVASEDRAPILV
jgi:hypothetical protein